MITEKAHAKINLSLDVVRKRSDGYHDLKMIMVPLELHDQMTFEIDENITLQSNVEIENNAILKAAFLMKNTYNVTKGAKIVLNKIIPMGAGLGGGSADIAATLRGLNRLWDLQLPQKGLEELALKLGSDTLFCLYNKPAYVYGRGEGLLYIQQPPIKSVYICYPEINVSTKKVFENHKINHEPYRFNRLFTLYVNEKFSEFFKKSYNVLTYTTFQLHPELIDIYKKMRRISKYTRMTGSGSTFYIPIFSENTIKIDKKSQKYQLNLLKTEIKR